MRDDRPREDFTEDEIFFCDREGVFLQAKGRDIWENMLGGSDPPSPGSSRVKEYPQFDIGIHVGNLSYCMYLQCLRSQGEQTYVAFKWMFALDHYLYARWMSVHLRDLLVLEVECPAVHFSVRLFPVGIIEILHVTGEASKPTPTKGQHNSARSRDQCCVNVSLATVERRGLPPKVNHTFMKLTNPIVPFCPSKNTFPN